jgi:hypothetical protein
MIRNTVRATVIGAVLLMVFGLGTRASAQRPNLAGRWTLNRNLSQLPDDVGFGMDLAGPPGSGSDSGGRGGGAANPASLAFRESEDDARRRDQLLDQVRNPSPRLTIVDTDTAVTLTDDRGRSLTFHPDGREESQMLDQVPVATTARWVAGRLEVRYKVQQNREVRYTYSRTADPPQLVVQVQLVERGGKGSITRIYEPTRANEHETITPDRVVAPAVPPANTGRPANTPPPNAPTPANAAPPAGGLVDSGIMKAGVPAVSGSGGAPVVAGGPDAEFKGITRLGVVVEDLSSQAAACGLKQAAIEAAVSKSLADRGLRVTPNSDEDTYIYVQIITTSSPGLCVSRYDVSLFTHATTTLSYQTAPVLARVLLGQQGGLAGGAPATHGEAVTRSVKQYVDDFATRIRAVNR